jgi:tRNA (guanine-N7-)-methyltransferase
VCGAGVINRLAGTGDLAAAADTPLITTSMRYASSPVTSNQQGVHPRLRAIVERHLRQAYRKPYAGHTRRAFEYIAAAIDYPVSPLILDAGCGSAESTRQLAAKYSDSWVVGIDKSACRLKKACPDRVMDNCLLVQADLVDFWRLAVAAGWHLSRHYILYPNPWPKMQHLQRRWHGSPLFSTILQLGGRLEVRSNWLIYIREFHAALQFAGQQATIEPYRPAVQISAFERKYHNSGHALWRCYSELKQG